MWDQNGSANLQMLPPSPKVSGDELGLLRGPRAQRGTAIWHQERYAEANWHPSQHHVPTRLWAEPPANWCQGKSFFGLVQLLYMDFVVNLPVSFTGGVPAHALGTVFLGLPTDGFSGKRPGRRSLAVSSLQTCTDRCGRHQPVWLLNT